MLKSLLLLLTFCAYSVLLELGMDGEMMEGGFGAGEGTDYLEGFGMEITGLEDLDKQAPIEALDVTLTTKDDQVDQVVEDVPNVIEKENEEHGEDDAVVPEQPSGKLISCH